MTILLLINPNLVYDDYVNSEYNINNVRNNTVTTSIINLINNPIQFTIDDTNKLKIKVVNNTQITDLNTKSYIICRYLFILKLPVSIGNLLYFGFIALVGSIPMALLGMTIGYAANPESSRSIFTLLNLLLRNSRQILRSKILILLILYYF